MNGAKGVQLSCFAEMGSVWSGRRDLNPRPPEPHLRVYLGTYADISCPEHVTSVSSNPRMCESARIRRAIDANISSERRSTCYMQVAIPAVELIARLGR